MLKLPIKKATLVAETSVEINANQAKHVWGYRWMELARKNSL